jgi:hypothetical protein
MHVQVGNRSLLIILAFILLIMGFLCNPVRIVSRLGNCLVVAHAATTGLVASYSFNEGSGTTVSDSSGNSNNGTINNASWTTSGKFGGALVFSGSSYVTVNDSPSLDLSSGMTLEAWVSPSSTPTTWSTAIMKEQPSFYIYTLYAGSPANQPNAYMMTAGGKAGIPGPSALPLNTWSHLAATYDGATFALYVNGALVATKSAATNLVQASGPLHIGGNDIWGEYFRGTIDEVRIYNRALAQAEIQNDMVVAIGGSALDTTPPTAPANLSAAPLGAAAASLSWLPSTDNTTVTGYPVERCPGSGCTNFAQIALATSPSFNDSGLQPSTAYNYRVRAADAAGNLSPYSNTAGAVTAAGSTPIAFVQSAYAVPSTPSTSVAVTYSSAQVAGDTNVVVVGWNDSTATVRSVSDSNGNPYFLAVGPTVLSGAISQSIYYAKNIAPASAKGNTFTVTFTSPARYPDVRVLEYSGLDPVNPLDSTAASTGSTSSSSSGTATTTNPTTVLFSANTVSTSTSGAGAGYTKRVITSPDGDIAQDRMVSTAGSYSANAPLSATGPWVMQLAAFKFAATLGAGAPLPIAVSVSPTLASLQTSQSTGFTATVQNDSANKGVSWTLSGVGCTGAACGTLTNVTTTSVTYNAPASAPSPATVTLLAASIADNTKSASATITITTLPPPISVTVNPTAASVQVSQSTGFTATVQNDPANKGVSWTLSGSGCTGAACGTLTNVTTTSVTYTAPANAPSPATVTLLATSIADNTKSASVIITIKNAVAGGAAPTLVTSRSASTTQGPGSGTDPAITTYVFEAPSLSLAGNAVLVGTTFRALGGSLSVALTNEHGDTFTNLVDATNGADNQRVITFCGFPAAGNYQYTLTFTGTGTVQYVQATMGEFNNIASCTPDAVSDNTGTSATTITAGELGALAHSGDFIFNYVAAANAPQIGTWTSGSQANIAWAKGRSDTVNAQVFQWGQYNATAGFTPTLTSSDSVDYVSEAVALPTAAAGTARPTTGIIVTGVQSIDTNGTDTGAALTFDMPTVGNLLVLMDSEANYGAISSITSSPALTWHQVCSSTEAPQYSSPWYASNTSPSTNMRITVNFLASSNSRSFQTYDVVGADPANPLDTGFGTNGCVAAQGSQPSQGPLTVGSGTPSNPGELIIMVNSLDNNSGTGWTSPSGVLFMQAHHGPVYSVPTTNDENDDWALVYTQGVSLLTFTMTADDSQGTGGVNKWAFSSAAFK